MSIDAHTIEVEENLWGYGRRLRFIDAAILTVHPRDRSRISVLDVGCGNGSQLAIPLARSGYRVTGIDTHGPSIETATISSSSARFIHGAVGGLPPERFDVVIISEVLEHLENPDALLADSLPFLSDTGVLIVTVPNGYGEFELDRRFYKLFRLQHLFLAVHRLLVWVIGRRTVVSRASSDDESDHIQRFTLGALGRLFERHRLVVTNRAATSVLSGPLIGHTLARSSRFIRFNTWLAEKLPLWASSGWMFALRKTV